MVTEATVYSRACGPSRGRRPTELLTNLEAVPPSLPPSATAGAPGPACTSRPQPTRPPKPLPRRTPTPSPCRPSRPTELPGWRRPRCLRVEWNPVRGRARSSIGFRSEGARRLCCRLKGAQATSRAVLSRLFNTRLALTLSQQTTARSLCKVIEGRAGAQEALCWVVCT